MHGVIAAVPTPVTETGAPEKDAFLENCEWVLSTGCDGLNILGSTGEANSLSTEQRKDVMGWAAEALPKDRLMVGTGTPSLAETVDLTRHADALGYGVALVLPPYYYKPASDAGLIAWYLALDAALGAAPIQIYFYNFPQMTGLAIPVDVISELAAKAPARFTGIKDSSGDLDYARAIVAANRKLSVFPSSETSLDCAARDGFAGCISATVNITGALSAKAWATRKNPDADLMHTIAAQRNAMAGPTLIAGIKHLVSLRTGNANWRRVLPPFTELDQDAAATLEEKLG